MSKQTTRPPFKLSGVADIKHLNVRKEGPDDEKILAVDVKLQFSKVDRRLCGYFDEALQDFLWRGDTNALIVRNAALAPVQYVNTVKGSVSIGLHKFSGCEISKFSITPADGGVITLGCSAAIYPSASDMPDLSKAVQDSEHVEIEAYPDLFDSQDVKSTKDAMRQFDNSMREHGVTSTVSDSDGEVLAEFGTGPDPLYDKAVETVLKERKASISLVQRELSIGYNRAAKLLEEMEKGGIVGPLDLNGKRKILASNAWNAP